MAISAGKRVLRLPLIGLKHWRLRRELEPERSRPKERNSRKIICGRSSRAGGGATPLGTSIWSTGNRSARPTAHEVLSTRTSPLVPILLHVVGGPARVEVTSVRSAPSDPALYLYSLPARILKLFPSLYPIQSCPTRHRVSRIGVLPAPLAKTRFLGQEAGLYEPPLAFSVDVPPAHGANLPNSCGQKSLAIQAVRLSVVSLHLLRLWSKEHPLSLRRFNVFLLEASIHHGSSTRPRRFQIARFRSL